MGDIGVNVNIGTRLTLGHPKLPRVGAYCERLHQNVALKRHVMKLLT
jgi:hypothetical protein